MLLNEFWENKYVKIIAFLLVMSYVIPLVLFYNKGNMPLFLMNTEQGYISSIDKYSTLRGRTLKGSFFIDGMEIWITGSNKRFIHPNHNAADLLKHGMYVTVWYHTANSLSQVVQIKSGSKYIIKHDEKKAWRITVLFLIHTLIFIAIIIVATISNRQKKKVERMGKSNNC